MSFPPTDFYEGLADLLDLGSDKSPRSAGGIAMSGSTLETLAQRLDRLERENRRLKIAGAFLVLALAAVGAMGQVLPKAVPKVVEAERFVLRDSTGRERAVLEMARYGPRIALLDETGTTKALLQLDLRPELVMFDEGGKPRIAVRGALSRLAGQDLGGNALELYGPTGQIQATLGGLNQSALLAIFDARDLRIRLGMLANPVLEMFDSRFKVRVRVDDEGVVLNDPNESARGIFGVTSAGAGILLKNASGRTTFAAP